MVCIRTATSSEERSEQKNSKKNAHFHFCRNICRNMKVWCATPHLARKSPTVKVVVSNCDGLGWVPAAVFPLRFGSRMLILPENFDGCPFSQKLVFFRENIATLPWQHCNVAVTTSQHGNIRGDIEVKSRRATS